MLLAIKKVGFWMGFQSLDLGFWCGLGITAAKKNNLSKSFTILPRAKFCLTMFVTPVGFNGVAIGYSVLF